MSAVDRGQVEQGRWPEGDPLRLALGCLGAGRAWLVGGRIRDRLLGRPGIDSDLALAEEAIGAARQIADRTGGSLVVLDARRDVARVVWPGEPASALDLARWTEPELEDDLRARDFTLNALALPLDAGGLAALDAGGDVLRAALRDPTGGLADLDAGRLRMTAPAALDADPLRLLRAARLAAELRFEIEPETATAIRARAPLASRPAGERQRSELLRLLAADRAAEDVARLERLGLLPPLLPELAATRGVEQSLPHDRDVYQHCLATLAAAEVLEAILDQAAGEAAAGEVPVASTRAAPVVDLRAPSAGGMIELEEGWIEVARRHAPRLRQHAALRRMGEASPRVWWRLAALLHDIGKTDTQRFDPERGRFRFHGHDRRGAEQIAGLAGRLRLGRREARFLETVLRHHLRPLHLAAAGGATRRGIHRYFRATGDLGVDIACLALADNASKGGVRPDFALHLARVTEALLAAWFEHPEEAVRPPLPLGGRELMAALELPPGPLVGALLEALAEAVASGELAPGDPSAAIALAERQLAELRTPEPDRP